MRWHGVLSGALFMAFILVLVLVANAQAQVPPYYSHGAGSDFCIQCHDVHEASGDYVLTREATVTAVCQTCHGMFGAPVPTVVIWSSPPPDFSGGDATASTLLAYSVDMTSMTSPEMDAVPGHSLGVMAGNAIVRELDSIPGGSSSLKVMTSGQYGEFNEGLYSGEPTTSFSGTKGLYCASCHTAHDTIGQMLPGPDLLSSKPNHVDTAAVDTLTFCLSCHDQRDNMGVEVNHSASYCLTCHTHQPGEPDFPHSSTNQKLLYEEPDTLCILCHTSGNLP